MPLPAPGEIVLGKYRITTRIGTGGMGAVFAAEHQTLGGLVALKFLLPELAARPDIAKRFDQEARAGRRITSAHVAKVHDIDKFGDVPFIVMEHLEGETLAAHLAKRGQLPVDEAVDLILQACEAVSEAHTLGIVHRDLKPANLFLTEDKGGGTSLKVLDFGISKFEDVAVTSSESLLGTPLYMSPEQVNDSAQVDARTDVWSLGVVLFEMLTGKRPFEGSNRSAIYVAIKSGRRPRLRALNGDIAPRLEDAVESALALVPENRVASVEAFAASIVQFGTKAGGASLTQIQRVAGQARPSPAVPSAALAPLAAPVPVHTAEGPRETLALDSGAGTPPPVAATNAPLKSRTRLLAALGVLATVATVSVVGVRSHWFSGRAAAAACADGATPACEAACSAKEPGACHALARAFENGKGAPADAARAAKLYQAECNSGGMAGCNSLGNLYDLGKGVPRDRDKALSLFQQACAGGSGPGCANLGNAYAEGESVVKDDVRAFDFYQVACEDHEPIGCANLGVFYAEGRGVKKDAARAYTYADRACAQGAQVGCVHVARAKILGEGIAKDTSGGLGQLEAMCAREEALGCDALATVYERGLGDVQADPGKSAEYLKRGCDLHYEVSCARRTGKKAIDLSSTGAARFNASLRDQCNAGKMESCELFGRYLSDGIGVPKDPDAGAEYLAKGVQWGEDVGVFVGGAVSGDESAAHRLTRVETPCVA